MKKSIIVVVVLLVAIALLPLIGNTLIKQRIDTQISSLKTVGLEIKSDVSSETYLHTSRHFEFLLKDSKAFVSYLNKYSKKQIPPYVNALLNGVVIGSDVEYLNLPFAKSFKVDLYPLTLSPKIADSLRQNDIKFYNYLEKFLQSKGILYHINYNLINSDFDGYMKDVDANQTLSNGMQMALKLQKVNFEGNGELIAPDRIQTKIKTLNIDLLDENQHIKLFLKKFASSSNFESQSTYLTSAELKELTMKIDSKSEDTNLSVKNFKVNASSNAQGEAVELESKSSMDSLNFHSRVLSVDMKKFHSAIAVNGLSKEVFKKLSTLLAQNQVNNSLGHIEAMKKSIIELVAQGFVLNIADFSVDKLSVNDAKDMDGFTLQSTITMKKDASLAQKIQLSPLLAIGSLDLKSKIALSKEFLALVVKNQALAQKIESYAKVEHNRLLYDISFIDAKTTINGKALQ